MLCALLASDSQQEAVSVSTLQLDVSSSHDSNDRPMETYGNPFGHLDE